MFDQMPPKEDVEVFADQLIRLGYGDISALLEDEELATERFCEPAEENTLAQAETHSERAA